MILWTIALGPILAGLLIWFAGSLGTASGEGRRTMVGISAVTVMAALLLTALLGAGEGTRATFHWGGPLMLHLAVIPMVKVMVVLIPLIALPIVLWAAATEEEQGLPRLIGLLVAFTGAMELTVLADDLLTLALAWELLGFLSWILIAHHWRDKEKVAAADYAFNATRLGGLGLWLAAAAVLAATGDLRFESLSAAAASSWSGWLAAGILAAAVSKSAQGPFAPWLFKAMEGPSSVSSLLHSSTMVAAGAWLLVRLHEPLSAVAWFGDAAIIIGLATAVAGGITACVQTGAKKVLAASTSAQYGLMFIAVGAGYPAAALVHLVTHAACKALLFLAAGSAIHFTGTHHLARMRLGAKLPALAAASWVGTLALAAIPPLGAAWSKEKIIAAGGHYSTWLALAVIAAASLSGWYALRFQTLAFGRRAGERKQLRSAAELGGPWLLAAGSLILGLLWLIGDTHAITRYLPGELAKGKLWELLLSICAVIIISLLSWMVYSRRRIRVRLQQRQREGFFASWWGLEGGIDRFGTKPASDLAAAGANFDRRWAEGAISLLLTRPVLQLAAACAAFDRNIIDGGVRGTAKLARLISHSVIRIVEEGVDYLVLLLSRFSLAAAAWSRRRLETAVDWVVEFFSTSTGRAGSTSRRLQQGAVPVYLAYLAGGLFFFFVTFIIGAW